MNFLRATWRLLFFVAYTILKSNQIVLNNLLFGKDIRRTLRIRRSWARGLLSELGIRMHSTGTPPDFPCILAVNHRSYLDPAVVAHDVLGYGVAKVEVSYWPVVGWGVRVAGVIFLKRENRHSRKRALGGIAEKVKAGFPVILFVEGTTHAQPTTIDFKPGGFKLAAAEGIAVVPAAIEFRSPEDYWIGDDTFLPHLFRRLAVKEKDAYIHYGPTLRSGDADELLRQAKMWIDAELAAIQKGF